MATGTAFYNLTKPAGTENYNVSVWNTNMDMIDAQMHQNETETFTGATDLAAGTVGNVPAPAITDKEKFLKGDGTWATPSGGSGAGAAEMTLSDYNELSTAQKNDGTIRFIPAGSGGGTSTPFDMSNLTAFREGAMGVVATSSTETNVSWNGGGNIGCTFYYTTPIDVTDYSTIKFTATNGQCYDGTVSQSMRDNWNIQIGLQIAAPTAIQVINKTDSRWTVVEDMNLVNHTYEGSIDVSNLTGTYYLVINSHGWNTVIEDITLDTGGIYPSQIKYMSKTYADGTGGGSAVVPNPTGTPTDTLDTVSIDGTIYEIQGSSGGGSGYTETVLNNGTQSGDVYTLSDNISNYDMLEIEWIYSGSYYGTSITSVESFKTNATGILVDNTDNILFVMQYTSETTMTRTQSYGSLEVRQIKGLKFGGGGGGIDYSTSEQDTGLKWTDNSSIYQKTINIVNSSSVAATRDIDLSSYIPSGARVIEFSGVYEYVYSSKNYGMAIGSNSVYGYMYDNSYKLKIDFGSGSFDSDEINLTIKYTKASS